MMRGTKGVNEVLGAWARNEALRRGNARTDGHSCFLFDNEIARDSPPECMRAEAKIFGYLPTETWFTFAGWPTETTLRHLRMYTAWAERSLFFRQGRIIFSGAPGMIGDYLELDANDWYCFSRIKRLLNERKEACESTN